MSIPKIFCTFTSPKRIEQAKAMLAYATKHYLDLFDEVQMVVTLKSDSQIGDYDVSEYQIHPGIYNRAWSKNAAIASMRYRYGRCILMLSDNDFCYERRCVENSLKYTTETSCPSTPFTVAYDSAHYQGSFSDSRRIDGTPFSAGCVTLDTDNVGLGYFEGLVGWGTEDDIFGWYAANHLGPIKSMTGRADHIRHDRGPMDVPQHKWRKAGLYMYEAIKSGHLPWVQKGSRLRGCGAVTYLPRETGKCARVVTYNDSSCHDRIIAEPVAKSMESSGLISTEMYRAYITFGI